MAYERLSRKGAKAQRRGGAGSGVELPTHALCAVAALREKCVVGSVEIDGHRCMVDSPKRCHAATISGLVPMGRCLKHTTTRGLISSQFLGGSCFSIFNTSASDSWKEMVILG